jgi:ADP-ribose pyrophosphatase YjhB (NUDIX family)
MHITQRKILAKLMYSESLRYSELKDKPMSGNQFTYHLDAMIRDGLVEKTPNEQYQLTLKGRRLSDKLSSRTLRRTEQPKLVVAVCIATTDTNEIVLQWRGRQPHAGVWSLPLAKIHFSESTEYTLQRIVHDRMNLAVELRGVAYKGIFGVRAVDPTGEVVSHTFITLYSARINPELLEELDPQRYQRFKLSKITDSANFYPGLRQVLVAREQSLLELTVESV